MLRHYHLAVLQEKTACRPFRRILDNLKAINLQKGNATNAMVCLDYQLMLYPDAVDLLQQQDELLKFLRDEGQSGESRLQ